MYFWFYCFSISSSYFLFLSFISSACLLSYIAFFFFCSFSSSCFLSSSIRARITLSTPYFSRRYSSYASLSLAFFSYIWFCRICFPSSLALAFSLSTSSNRLCSSSLFLSNSTSRSASLTRESMFLICFSATCLARYLLRYPSWICCFSRLIS